MDTKLTALTRNSTPKGGDYGYIVDDPAGTPLSQYFQFYDVFQTGPLNYKITPTVSSNNLTVALKTLSGGNPSLTDPLLFKIGDSWRVVTSALSITMNAATNWMNLGGAEMAANEQDLFVYIGYNATDGVVLGASRIPYASQYSDFNTTQTNQKYARISTITTAAASDPYTVIGRFAATLSAGAGYTWTVPTYTPTNLIQYPIYQTRVLSWTPTWTNLTIGNGTQTAKYQIKDSTLEYHQEVVFGSTTAISGDITHTLPMTAASHYAGALGIIPGTALLRDAGTANYPANPIFTSTSVSIRAQLASGTYASNVVCSSTVPFTWTTSDEVYEWARYFIG